MLTHRRGPSTLPEPTRKRHELNLIGNQVATASRPPARSKATGRTIWLSLGAIALVGGAATYGRTLGVIQAVDGRSLLAWFEAALAEPTIAAASVSLLDAHRRKAGTPWFSVVSILVAAAFTISAQVVYGQPHPLPRWLVNVWPPVAFLLALESLMSYVRRSQGDGAAAAGSHDDPCPHGVAATLDEAIRLTYEHERDCEGAAPTFVDLAARFATDRKRVAELVRQPAPQAPVAALNGAHP